MKIVIIDDEIDLCFILGAEVKALGHEVETFNSALDAKKYLESDEADTIICDYHLPRMTGLELFNWLKQTARNIPFVILTGEPLVDEKKLLNDGISAILYKPQDIGNLEDCINKICSRTP